MAIPDNLARLHIQEEQLREKAPADVSGKLTSLPDSIQSPGMSSPFSITP